MTLAIQNSLTLEAANRALQAFAVDSRIERREGKGAGWYVCWENRYQGKVERRWQCRIRQDFYPVWSDKWPHGGTACTALSQLIRWLKGMPVLPISSWRYWESETVALCKPGTAAALLEAGYPEHADCVLCGEPINGKLDWWHLNGVSGPCCGWTTGCRQKGHQ